MSRWSTMRSSGSHISHEAELVLKMDDVTMLDDYLLKIAVPDQYKIEFMSLKLVTNAVRLRASLILTDLLGRGANFHDIRLPHIAIFEEVTKNGDDDEWLSPTFEVLQILIDHGWSIDNLGAPSASTYPLLWHVCASPKFVKWCLDHGANVVIPGETTSRNPCEGEIFHTPRHPLLLEAAAGYATVSTFKLLLDHGAPLAPGRSWPPTQAPRILDRAVDQAIIQAPELGKAPCSQYLGRIAMLKYLLNEVGLEADRSTLSREKLQILPFPLTSEEDTIFEDTKRIYNSNKNLGELVALLLDAGASQIYDTSKDGDYRAETPLAFIESYCSVAYSRAVKEWQQSRYGVVSSATEESQNMFTYTGPAYLSNLPAEILHLIAANLELSDVLRMRLTNHSISSGVDKVFEYHIRKRRISLETKHLQGLCEAVDAGGLICKVEEIVIEEPISQESRKGPAVSECLTNFLRVSKIRGRLKSLNVHKCSRAGLVAILAALQESGLNLHGLHLYQGTGSMSVSIDHYREFGSLQKLIPSLANIRDFSWSLNVSERQGVYHEHAGECSPSNMVFAPRNVAVIDELLKAMPSIETLELFWFKNFTAGRPESYFLDACYPALLNMKALKECSLIGMYATEESLREFLEQTSARRITLQQFHLSIGTFRSIIDIMTSGSLDYFHIDDVYEANDQGYNILRFEVPGLKKGISNWTHHGPTEIIREGKEAKRKLQYKLGLIYPNDPNLDSYLQHVWGEYGKD